VKSQILPLHFAVGYQISLLLDAGGWVKSMIFAEISPLHDAERNKISLLQNAAGNQISPTQYNRKL
jgi:hypothetical protein